MNDQIVQWKCAKCGEAIAGSEGFLSIDMHAVDLAEQGLRGREPRREWPQSRDLLPPIAVRQSERVQWRGSHIACDPESGQSFSIDVADIATLSRVLAWTLHFMDSKSWIRHTDWTSFVRAQTGVDLRQAPR